MDETSFNFDDSPQRKKTELEYGWQHYDFEVRKLSPWEEKLKNQNNIRPGNFGFYFYNFFWY